MKKIEIDSYSIESLLIAFRQVTIKEAKLYKWTMPLLNEIRKAGINVFALVNAQKTFTDKELKNLGIYKYFDEIYYSSDYLISKPDVKFLEMLIKTEKLIIEKTILISNDKNDIAMANIAGIDSFFVNTDETAMEAENKNVWEKVTSTFATDGTLNAKEVDDGIRWAKALIYQ